MDLWGGNPLQHCVFITGEAVIVTRLCARASSVSGKIGSYFFHASCIFATGSAALRGVANPAWLRGVKTGERRFNFGCFCRLTVAIGLFTESRRGWVFINTLLSAKYCAYIVVVVFVRNIMRARNYKSCNIWRRKMRVIVLYLYKACIYAPYGELICRPVIR